MTPPASVLPRRRKLRRAGLSIAGTVWTAGKLAAEDSTGGAEFTNPSTTVPDPASRFVDMVATLLSVDAARPVSRLLKSKTL
jgi:hypothetical protein